VPLIRIRERVPGCDPERFWAAPLEHARLLDMRDKYAAQLELARTTEAERKPLLRALASRWPGSLREAELIGPVEVAARLERAQRGLALAEQPAREWLAQDESAAALLLWSSLHAALADLLRFRRSSLARPSVTGLADWIAADPSLAERWPAAKLLPERLGDKLELRCAYLWSCARTGLALAQLNQLLFARAGHWDRRPSDPEWAHD